MITDTNNATPRPWKAFPATKSSNFGDWKARIVTDAAHAHDSVAYAMDRPMDTKERTEANADLIVRAVNAHDALVDVAWRALGYAIRREHGQDEPITAEFTEACRTALALAGKA